MSENNSRSNEKDKTKVYKCGIVMPIADHSDYNGGHWKEILSIIKEVVNKISDYNFNCELVSESNGIVDPIHKHIVNNLFDADIIICDISSKNPNVFFELGMRLAFDKPVVILKDDKTESPFDTGVIRYIEYDSNLRYSNINEFKKELRQSIVKTLDAKLKNNNFSPFLKYFKEIEYNPQDKMESERVVVPNYVSIMMNKLDAIERTQAKIAKQNNISESLTEKIGYVPADSKITIDTGQSYTAGEWSKLGHLRNFDNEVNAGLYNIRNIKTNRNNEE